MWRPHTPFVAARSGCRLLAPARDAEQRGTAVSIDRADAAGVIAAVQRAVTGESIRVADQAATTSAAVSAAAAGGATAVQRAVTRDAVVGAGCRPTRLAALTGRRADRARRQSRSAASTADAARAEEGPAALGAIGTGAAIVAAAIERAVGAIPVIGADHRTACLRLETLTRGDAGRPRRQARAAR